MVIVYLTESYEMKPFDCGDADLNGFLLNDAKLYAEKKLAYTYIFATIYFIVPMVLYNYWLIQTQKAHPTDAL